MRNFRGRISHVGVFQIVCTSTTFLYFLSNILILILILYLYYILIILVPAIGRKICRMERQLDHNPSSVGDFLMAIMRLDSTTPSEGSIIWTPSVAKQSITAEVCKAVDEFLKQSGWRTRWGPELQDGRPSYLLATRSEATDEGRPHWLIG